MTVDPQSLAPPLTHPCFGWRDNTVQGRHHHKGLPWFWIALGAGALLIVASGRKEKRS
jgi:hypothetical protein